MSVIVKGGGGENVKAEVDIQAPLIAQILQNLGFTADPAEGTNKQKLQTNNANLAKISDYLPHGAYVWKKLTAQGGDFVNFVVSDQSTAYPDGGTQDGYWYEKLMEGIDLKSLLGYTKLAVDRFTFASSTSCTTTVSHSLGVVPKFILLMTQDTITINGAVKYVFAELSRKYSGSNGAAAYYHSSFYALVTVSTTVTCTDTNFNFSDRSYAAGKEYIAITMA